MSTAYWRVNSLAIVGAAIALISVFLPWWGIYELVGSSVMLFAHWTLWSPTGSAVLRKLGRPRFPINSKHLSDIHHFKPHSADSSPGRGITRPCWRPHSRPEILGSRTGSVNLNTNRLHHQYSLRDIQLLPIVPLCASGPIGNGTVLGTTYTWGFETGFYIFIVGIVFSPCPSS